MMWQTGIPGQMSIRCVVNEIYSERYNQQRWSIIYIIIY